MRIHTQIADKMKGSGGEEKVKKVMLIIKISKMLKSNETSERVSTVRHHTTCALERKR